VGLAALAGCQKSVDTAAVVDEAKRGSRDWTAAYNSGDVETIVAKYSDNATIMPPGAPAASGHDAIREFLTKDSAGAKAAGVTLVIKDGDEAGVSGDLAWHSGGYTVNDANGNAVDSGSYLEVLQNMDGKWMIIRDTWNSDRAPAPAAAPAAEAAAAPAT
jgi:ketosteroid isomerase-like protein